MIEVINGNDGVVTTLRVRGDLTGPEVGELEHRWQVAKHSNPQLVRVDLRKLGAIDHQGKDLLERMFFNGVELVVRCTGPGSPEPLTQVLRGRAPAKSEISLI